MRSYLQTLSGFGSNTYSPSEAVLKFDGGKRTGIITDYINTATPFSCFADHVFDLVFLGHIYLDKDSAVFAMLFRNLLFYPS